MSRRQQLRLVTSRSASCNTQALRQQPQHGSPAPWLRSQNRSSSSPWVFLKRTSTEIGLVARWRCGPVIFLTKRDVGISRIRASPPGTGRRPISAPWLNEVFSTYRRLLKFARVAPRRRCLRAIRLNLNHKAFRHYYYWLKKFEIVWTLLAQNSMGESKLWRSLRSGFIQSCLRLPGLADWKTLDVSNVHTRESRLFIILVAEPRYYIL